VDFDLLADVEQLRRPMRKFVDEAVIPVEHAIDRDNIVPDSILREAARLGLLDLSIAYAKQPVQFGRPIASTARPSPRDPSTPLAPFRPSPLEDASCRRMTNNPEQQRSRQDSVPWSLLA
jgi:hypothetical protein